MFKAELKQLQRHIFLLRDGFTPTCSSSAAGLFCCSLCAIASFFSLAVCMFPSCRHRQTQTAASTFSCQHGPATTTDTLIWVLHHLRRQRAAGPTFHRPAVDMQGSAWSWGGGSRLGWRGKCCGLIAPLQFRGSWLGLSDSYWK